MAIQIKLGEQVKWNPVSTPCIVENQENGRAHIRMMGGIPHFILDVPENELTPLSSGGRIPPISAHDDRGDGSWWESDSWLLWPMFILLLMYAFGFGVWVALSWPAPPWLIAMILGAVVGVCGWKAVRG